MVMLNDDPAEPAPISWLLYMLKQPNHVPWPFVSLMQMCCSLRACACWIWNEIGSHLPNLQTSVAGEQREWEIKSGPAGSLEMCVLLYIHQTDVSPACNGIPYCTMVVWLEFCIRACALRNSISLEGVRALEWCAFVCPSLPRWEQLFPPPLITE